MLVKQTICPVWEKGESCSMQNVLLPNSFLQVAYAQMQTINQCE